MKNRKNQADEIMSVLLKKTDEECIEFLKN